MPATHRLHDQNGPYRLRILGSTAGAILLLILIFRFWPLPSDAPPEAFPYHTGGQELISIEEVQPTRQSQKPPPPPPPVIPFVVPDDIVLEQEVEFEEAFLTLEEYGEAESPDQPAPAGNAGASKAPDVAPRAIRLVEAEFPRAAMRKKIKAEVVVEVLVDKKGKVQDTRVVEQYLYGKSGKALVTDLGYGLEESARSAAARWMFRPARQNGYPVESYHTITFSFGV
ncbi:MAG: energy transducer TonB [Bacteroidota bacterium]